MSQLLFYFAGIENLELHLVLYGRSPEVFFSIPDSIIQHWPKKKFNNSLRFISTIARLKYLRSTIRQVKPGSILSFGERWNSFVLLALSRLKYPVYVSDRCSPDYHLGLFHELLRKRLYQYAEGIIVQTKLAKEIYAKQFKRSIKLKVIGNPIREIPFNSNIKKENIVLTVGRLIPSKNHSRLIDSFLRLGRSDWKLLIVGGNALKMDLMEELRLKVVSLGAEDRIIFTDNKPDVEQFYLMSKIFVLASESEGFPNVIGEAMSAGLPVVAFDCVAGPSDMITDNVDGFLVPLHDYNMLESRLILLMSNPELAERIGNEARKSIKRFSLSVIGEEYLSFIASIN